MSDWRPSAHWDVLCRRAELLATLRAFFSERGVLEVETPLLCSGGSTDPHLDSFSTDYLGPGAPASRADDDGDTWRQLLWTHAVEPELGRNGQPVFVVAYPASQAMLARVRPGPPAIAERFELYIDGLELANGFHELGDADEQRRRFAADLHRRSTAALPAVPIDQHLLAALEHGLPSCSGVAVGVDRLMMVQTGARAIADVLSFPLERC